MVYDAVRRTIKANREKSRDAKFRTTIPDKQVAELPKPSQEIVVKQ